MTSFSTVFSTGSRGPPPPRSSRPRSRRRPGGGKPVELAGQLDRLGSAQRMGGDVEDLRRKRRVGDVEAVERARLRAGADRVHHQRLLDGAPGLDQRGRARPPARSGSPPADGPGGGGAPPRAPRRRRGGSGCRYRSGRAASSPLFDSPLGLAVERDPELSRPATSRARCHGLRCSRSRSIRCRTPHCRSRNWRSSCRKAKSDRSDLPVDEVRGTGQPSARRALTPDPRPASGSGSSS